MKSRRKHGFQFMTILYFMIVFGMCVSRFNVIMTIMGYYLACYVGIFCLSRMLL